jgi:type II secretory pathway component PulF
MGNRGVIRLGLKDQLRLVESVVSLLNAGLSLSQAFAGTASSDGRSAPTRVARQIHSRLRDGVSLTTAVSMAIAAPHPFLLAMVKVSDETGAAGALLSRAGDHLRVQIDFSESARTAAIYPAFVILLTLVGALLLQLMVFPELSSFLGSAGLLESEQAGALMSSGGRFTRTLFAVVGGLGALAVLARVRPTPDSPGPSVATALARVRLRVPVFGPLERTRDLLSVAEATTAMLGCGVPFDRALERAVGCTRNSWIALQLLCAVERIRAGGSPAQAMVPVFGGHGSLSHWLGQSESGGDLTVSLESMARTLRDTCKRQITRLGAVVEPLLVVIAGGILLATVSVLVRPLFGLYEVVMP